ncbi:polysaccharide pyruvyl transferase family protein [Pseudarthrobacter equi]|uniref:polysaccharide pyruvyl transferase family protein n=1 Tax=Pseudarthrobacter equi TaxID=728066 RepID=UPI0021BE8BB5|nr:polysaccharide pyruvyl transferase family protein [Pseudarthrobacter equi]MCT9625637.1 polysaccharide pyruvyl transferase family protein [Pseudarthrobacter equi]
MHSRVAVIIRTKNRGRLLGRALDSVLGQTLNDWVIVLVNDGGSRTEVDSALGPRLAAIGERMLRIDNESSLGMEAASNLGIRAVDSEFIAVHDDDDEWAPEFLATTVAYLQDHPDDGGVSVETEIVFERLTREGREVEERVRMEPDLREITLVDLLHYNRFVPISFLFRRSVYDELGGFDEDLAVVGDWEFHLRFLVSHHIGLIRGRPLAFWNQRRSAVSSEANSVIAGLDEHHFYSLKVRDRLLREHAREFGLGPLLYQRELLAVETGRIHERIEELARRQEEGNANAARLADNVQYLQHLVKSAAQPFALRAARSVRRRLRERHEGRQLSEALQPVRQTAVVPSPAASGREQRVAIFGDVGQREYHVGDEAMTHAAIDELRKRGVNDFVVLTHDVEQTSRLYGLPAAQRPEVPWNAYVRHQLLQDVKQLIEGGPATEDAARVVRTFQDAFQGCSTLLLTGGGNLTSQYGGLLFERLAAIRVAHAMGLKILVSGQTVGPVLTGPDREEAAEALRLSAVTGSRERHTHELLASLGVPSMQVLDDATFLSPADPEHLPDVPASGYIAATFAPASGAMKREDYHRHMASLLDLAYEQLQLPILLLPHVSTFGAKDGDQDCHASIARLTKAPDVRVMDQMDSLATATLTAKADLVISSRYHPVVFGLAAGLPVLPVAVDYYGEVRIGGALENWGLAPLLRSLRHLGDGNDAKWVNSVLGQRAEIRKHLQQHATALAEFHDSWWDALAGAVSGADTPKDFGALPDLNNKFPLPLERAESAEAARLNASNEIAIGNLAQHSDWLQGQLDSVQAPAAGLPGLLGTVLDAGERLGKARPAALVRNVARRVLR